MSPHPKADTSSVSNNTIMSPIRTALEECGDVCTLSAGQDAAVSAQASLWLETVTNELPDGPCGIADLKQHIMSLIQAKTEWKEIPLYVKTGKSNLDER